MKTGGLADVAGALPAALPPKSVSSSHAGAGLSRRARRRWQAAEPVLRESTICSAARRGCCAGRAGGARPVRARRAASLRRDGNPYVGPRRARLAGQRPALRRPGARSAPISARGLVPGLRPDVVHAHDWQAGLTRRLSALQRTAPRPAFVMTIHNLAFQGQFPAGHPAGARPAAAGLLASTASNITAASAFSRPACSSPTASPRCRRPMPRKSARPKAAWAWTGCCARARPTLSRHPQRHRHDSLESRQRDAPLPQPFTAARRCADRAANKAAPLRPVRAASAGRAAVRRGQPAVVAEGPRPAARQPADAAQARAPPRDARRRRAGAGARRSAPAAQTRPDRRCSSAMTNISRI